ncbi:MAG: hypothetical protein CMN00_08565 [Rickettsiales bacterium]|nr:hypothetical protein [Rickettsiales bacterium]
MQGEGHVHHRPQRRRVGVRLDRRLVLYERGRAHKGTVFARDLWTQRHNPDPGVETQRHGRGALGVENGAPAVAKGVV